MIDPLAKDSLFGFLKTAMDAASLQHQVLSANLANIDTPGYKAMNVDFRQIMKDFESHESMRRDSGGATGERSLPVPPLQPFDMNAYVAKESKNNVTQRPDGNNVDLDKTMAEMGAARGNYQLASMFMTRKIRLLSEVINTRV